MSMRVLTLTLAAVLASCGGSSRSSSTPAVTAPTGRDVTADATLATKSEDVTFTAGGRAIPGTLVTPTEPGPWPAVLLLAGSGPTDRDWNSPLIASKNGSAKLLAEALAQRGAIVLRFDKAGTGGNPGPPPEALTIDTYRDEASSALTLLRARPDVRPDRMFVAGHSEGAIHATRLAQHDPSKLAGVIYLAPASRTLADTVMTQLENQLRNPLAGLTLAQIDAELAMLRKAFDEFRAGRPVDAKTASTLPPVQMLATQLFSPASAPLARALLFFDNAAEASKLALPILIASGGKDVQVDPDIDVRRLERALVDAKRDVTLHIAPDADHVLKHEPKTMPELRANLGAVQTGYNAEGRTLDPGLVDAVVAWLAAHTR